MDSKKNANQVLKDYSNGNEIKILDFIRFKVGYRLIMRILIKMKSHKR